MRLTKKIVQAVSKLCGKPQGHRYGLENVHVVRQAGEAHLEVCDGIAAMIVRLEDELPSAAEKAGDPQAPLDVLIPNTNLTLAMKSMATSGSARLIENSLVPSNGVRGSIKVQGGTGDEASVSIAPDKTTFPPMEEVMRGARLRTDDAIFTVQPERLIDVLKAFDELWAGATADAKAKRVPSVEIRVPVKPSEPVRFVATIPGVGFAEAVHMQVNV